MGATQRSTTDPVQLVRQLDPRLLRDRLNALDAERKALIVLLRAAEAVERKAVPRD
jgi:hypothetical protein